MEGRCTVRHGLVDGSVDQSRSRMLAWSSFALEIKKQTETSCWKMVEHYERNYETFIAANTAADEESISKYICQFHPTFIPQTFSISKYKIWILNNT